MAKVYQIYFHATFCAFVWLRFTASGHAILNSGARALSVVEAYPVIDDPFCLEPYGDFVEVNGLLS